jgi:RHS repeat-associated protein
MNPANETVTRTYDAANRILEITDGLNRSSRFTHDNLDRVTEVRDALNGLRTYTFDANDNVTQVDDPNNHPVERNVYDLRNRLKTKTDAKNKNTTYSYDLVGNVTQVIDRKGQITQYTYDKLNRITQIRDHDNRITDYVYDLASNVARISDTQSGDMLMTHDALNRVTQVITAQGTMSYTYDALGRRLTRSLSGDDVTTYSYDKASRLKSVTLRGKTVTYAYDPAGRLTEKVLPNGIKAIYSYDDADRLLSIAYSKLDASPIETINYSYDAASQRVQKSLATGSLQEMASTATYDEANRLTSITLDGEVWTLGYDDNGNLTSKTGPASGTTSYAWNARNQLAAISGPAGNATFKYDARGRRIEKTIDGVTTVFLYDGDQAVAELKGGAFDTVYHTGLALDEILARYAAIGNKTLLTDALRSVVAQANDDQSIANFYAYAPYGQAATLGADLGNALQYTGRENDETGLYYYRARYYDPAMRRFISEDPIGLAGGLNLFSYVGGNPISFNDPKGLEPGSSESRGYPPVLTPQQIYSLCMATELPKCPPTIVVTCAGLCAFTAPTGPGFVGCAIGCACVGAYSCYKLTDMYCKGSAGM